MSTPLTMRQHWMIRGVCLVALIVLAISTYVTHDKHVEAVRDMRPFYTDPGTGCQYIYSDYGGITPRLNIEGRPMCGTVIEKPKVRKDA